MPGMISPSVKPVNRPGAFTTEKVIIHRACNTVRLMPTTREPALHEALCDRFALAQEASLLAKGKFAARVGLTGPQFTNIIRYRNPPSHEAIRAAVREFGFTTDWFYFGSTIGFRDPDLAERLRNLQSRA